MYRVTPKSTQVCTGTYLCTYHCMEESIILLPTYVMGAPKKVHKFVQVRTYVLITARKNL